MAGGTAHPPQILRNVKVPSYSVVFIMSRLYARFLKFVKLPPPAGCSGGHSFVDRRFYSPPQNSNRSANWSWRSGGKVSLMTPAEPAKLLPEKTIIWGNRKFA